MPTGTEWCRLTKDVQVGPVFADSEEPTSAKSS